MPSLVRSRLLLAATLLCGAVVVRVAHAQDVAPTPRFTFASRSQIDSMAKAAEAAAHAAPAGSAQRDERTHEAAFLRQRLQTGDFAVGDRIVLQVQGQPTLSDTFTVRSGSRLQLPGMPDLPLQGVLRSEVEERVRDELARYIRDPQVRAIPLLRIVVSGSVVRPGFYALPADVLVSDAIMAAGGPTPTADLAKVELRRGTERVAAKSFAASVREGVTLDQAHLRAGDEILVGERHRRNWGIVLQGLSVAAGLLTLVVALRH